jgi:hypothetical protein
MIDRDHRAPQPPLSLLEYLQQHGWKIVRDSGREEVAGLCPLHRDTRPSFYVNRRKQVFYCHGCGRGGGLARLIRWLKPAEESKPDLPADQTNRCWNGLTISINVSWRAATKPALI